MSNSFPILISRSRWKKKNRRQFLTTKGISTVENEFQAGSNSSGIGHWSLFLWSKNTRVIGFPTRGNDTIKRSKVPCSCLKRKIVWFEKKTKHDIRFVNPLLWRKALWPIRNRKTVDKIIQNCKTIEKNHTKPQNRRKIHQTRNNRGSWEKRSEWAKRNEAENWRKKYRKRKSGVVHPGIPLAHFGNWPMLIS